MRTVLDEYDVVTQIPAPGGMGLVYRARGTSGEVIALKVVPLGRSAESEAIARSERRGAEVQQLLGQKDPHVPRVYAFGEKHGVFFIEMEFVAGEDLSALLARVGPLPPAEAARIAYEVASFLNTAHHTAAVVDPTKDFVGPRVSSSAVEAPNVSTVTSELVHSDLKPANIRMVHGTGEIKILDFGIARAGWHTATTNQFGSLCYMSPERIEGRIDRHADYWALGVVLYEMLAGNVPFRVPAGPSHPQQLQQLILKRMPPLPLPPTIPLPLQAIVIKLLRGELARRYQDAADIKADLGAFLSGKAPAALAEFRQPHEGDTIIVAPLRQAASTPREATIAVAPGKPRSRSYPPLKRAALFACMVAFGVLSVDACAVRRASRELMADLRSESGVDPDVAWARYESIRRWATMPLFASDARFAVAATLVEAADRVLVDFRTDAPAVRATRWAASRGWLEKALSLRDNRRIRARLASVQAHLLRIEGGTRRNQAQRATLLQDAVRRFEEAARLDPESPDPYVGLARLYSVEMIDFDRASQAVAEAERRGQSLGRRAHAQLGDAIRRRAEEFRQSAVNVRGLPEERGYLESAVKDYEQALEFYTEAKGFGLVAHNVRLVRRRLGQVRERLMELEQ
jgi:serine/threonine protein kinase/tetratricopeptide (TPR) repeat protein